MNDSSSSMSARYFSSRFSIFLSSLRCRSPCLLFSAFFSSPLSSSASSALLLLTVLNLLNFLDRFLPSSLKPRLQHVLGDNDHDLTDAQTALPNTAFLAAYLLAGASVAMLVDTNRRGGEGTIGQTKRRGTAREETREVERVVTARKGMRGRVRNGETIKIKGKENEEEEEENKAIELQVGINANSHSEVENNDSNHSNGNSNINRDSDSDSDSNSDSNSDDDSVTSDHKMRIRLLSIGIVLWSIATIFSAFAIDFSTYVLSRSLVGVGEAFYSSIAPIVICTYYPPSLRSRALSLFYLSVPIGAALGFALGSLLAAIPFPFHIAMINSNSSNSSSSSSSSSDSDSWRSPFLICSMPGLLCALAVSRLKLNLIKKRENREDIDAERAQDSHVNSDDHRNDTKTDNDVDATAVDDDVNAYDDYEHDHFDNDNDEHRYGYSLNESAVRRRSLSSSSSSSSSLSLSSCFRRLRLFLSTSVSSWMLTLRILFRNTVYMHATIGFIAVTFATGGMADWLPTYLSRVYASEGVTASSAGLSVGAITVIAGIAGTVFGHNMAVREDTKQRKEEEEKEEMKKRRREREEQEQEVQEENDIIREKDKRASVNQEDNERDQDITDSDEFKNDEVSALSSISSTTSTSSSSSSSSSLSSSSLLSVASIAHIRSRAYMKICALSLSVCSFFAFLVVLMPTYPLCLVMLLVCQMSLWCYTGPLSALTNNSVVGLHHVTMESVYDEHGNVVRSNIIDIASDNSHVTHRSSHARIRASAPAPSLARTVPDSVTRSLPQLSPPLAPSSPLPSPAYSSSPSPSPTSINTTVIPPSSSSSFLSLSVHARALAFQTLVIHLFGDAISPVILGALSDATNSLKTAFLIVPIVLTLAATVWIKCWRQMNDNTK